MTGDLMIVSGLCVILMIVSGLCVILAAIGAAALAQRYPGSVVPRIDPADRDRLDTLPEGYGVLLTGNAGREALSATLRQLEGGANAPILCSMSGQRVNHVGLITCPARGCHRSYVDVDMDGRVEAHWTKPALPLPAERYEGVPF